MDSLQKTPVVLLAVFFIMSLGIALAGFFYSEHQQRAMRQHAEGELAGISELKTHQITDWRKERLGDALVFSKNPALARWVQDFFSSPWPPEKTAELHEWMTSIGKACGYVDVMLLDSRGKVRMAVGAHPLPLEDDARSRATESIRSHKIIFSDFHRTHIDIPHLDLCTPLILPAAKGMPAQCVGVLLLRINPWSILYPLIQSWPTASSTGETLLLRREGREVVYLSELRHRINTALNFRLPITDPHLVGARAAQGERGILEGRDYRGIPVLASVRQVPDTPWILVTKVDADEIFVPMRFRTRTTQMGVLSLIALAALATALRWKQDQAEYYKRREEASRQAKKDLEVRVRERTIELSQANEALRKAGFYHRSLIEASLDPLVTIGPDGRITDVNTATEAATGRARAELIGTDFSNCFTEPEKARAVYRQVFREGLVRDDPLELRHRDGRTLSVLYNASTYRDETGRVTGVFAAARDITRRKQMEKALRENNEILERIFATAHFGLVYLDRNFNFIRVNKTYADACGYPAEFFPGKNHFDLYHHTENEAIFREVVETGAPYTAQAKPFEFPDHPEWGVTYWDWTLQPLKNASGKVETLLFVLLDVTERKHAEIALQRSEASLREAQRIAHIGNWERDLARQTLTWSEEVYRIFEINPLESKASEEACLNAIHPDDREFVVRAYSDSLRNKTPHDTVHRLRMKDGRIKYVNERCETSYDSHDQPLRSIGTVQDITERKQAEEALRRAHDELERRVQERTAQLTAANRELDAFSYSVSHDLRTPLRAMDGFSKALLEDCAAQLDARGRNHLQRIRAAAQRMGELIDDLLKLSKITRTEIKRTQVDLSALATEIAGERRKDDPERQVEFVIAPGLAANADPSLLRILLENLLDNAWKFTSRHAAARIEVGTTDTPSVPPTDLIDGQSPVSSPIYFVRDNGAGFDMTYVAKLFGAFQRLHPAEDFPGTGIGLANVHRIVYRHNGRVWADAAVEKGATFYFTLS